MTMPDSLIQRFFVGSLDIVGDVHGEISALAAQMRHMDSATYTGISFTRPHRKPTQIASRRNCVSSDPLNCGWTCPVRGCARTYDEAEHPS